MTLTNAERDRIRWHCRRGMLELDLVLRAFLETHLESLAPQQLDVLRGLLERADPELLDFVMGHEDPTSAAELELILLMRAASVTELRQPISSISA